jgi:hypothetical protein
VAEVLQEAILAEVGAVAGVLPVAAEQGDNRYDFSFVREDNAVSLIRSYELIESYSETM